MTEDIDKAISDLHSAPAELALVQNALDGLAKHQIMAAPRMVAQPVNGRIFLHLSKEDWLHLFDYLKFSDEHLGMSAKDCLIFIELITQFDFIEQA